MDLHRLRNVVEKCVEKGALRPPQPDPSTKTSGVSDFELLKALPL